MPVGFYRRGTNDAMPKEYATFLSELKDRIRDAHAKAFLSVNRELIGLYWQIGKGIVERQQRDGWGEGIVDRLATDIQREFPGIEGFSPRNIWRMRAFYLAWTEEISDLAEPLREIGNTKLTQPTSESDSEVLPQPVAELPWSHNIILIEKLNDPLERLWYAQRTIEHGWSRATLVHHIELDLCGRQGKAITNFARSLPPPQSDLAGHSLKDPYIFDFLSMNEDIAEKSLERGLIENIRKFLLELGTGFAFVGSQYHLEIDGEDFYIDLLFYHIRLRCFVIIDLKAGNFKPEYAGKMNFYLAALDDRLRHPTDNPSIGIILCKTNKKVIAEYALRNMAAPIGVSEYLLTRKVPVGLKADLPSIKDIEKKLTRKG